MTNKANQASLPATPGQVYSCCVLRAEFCVLESVKQSQILTFIVAADVCLAKSVCSDGFCTEKMQGSLEDGQGSCRDFYVAVVTGDIHSNDSLAESLG